ncbi:hypothetical protein ACFL4W_05555 [Planctomycetota bacterium]
MERNRREPGTGVLVPILIFTVMLTSIAAAVLYMRADKISSSTSGLKEEVEQLRQAHADCDTKTSELQILLDASKGKEAEAAKKYKQQAEEVTSLSGSYESWRKKAESLKRENTILKTVSYKSGREKDKKFSALQMAKAKADQDLLRAQAKIKALEQVSKVSQSDYADDLTRKNTEIRALKKEIENLKANP